MKKETYVIRKNELLAYIDRKCGAKITNALQLFIDQMKSAPNVDRLLQAQSDFISTLSAIRRVSIVTKRRYFILYIEERTFRMYYIRNSYKNLFFVLDYKKRDKYHYFYQKIDKDFDVTLFE